MRCQLPPTSFDLVMNCGVLEGIGLAGFRGNGGECGEEDLELMVRLRDVMTSGGLMLLSLPVGTETVLGGGTRVYGGERLGRILEGYELVEEEFWRKNADRRWVRCGRDQALEVEARSIGRRPEQSSYALGLMVLRKPGPRSG
jgi:hypothetical protein